MLLPGSSCPSSHPLNLSCITGTSCNSSSSVCNCDLDNSFPSPFQPESCYVPHGESCTGANDCDPFANLECVSNKCVCKGEDDTSYFDPKSKTCFKLAGSDCTPGEHEMKCTASSVCAKDGTSYRCQCSRNMTNVGGHCFLQHMANCDPFNDHCDSTKFLKCSQQSKCECSTDGTSIYSEEKDECVLLPEAICSNLPDEQSCIDAIVCNSTTNTCKCPDISLPSKNNPAICVIKHGQPCLANALCDPYDFLECSAGSECVCIGEGYKSYFDTKSRSCFIFAGEQCEPETTTMPCVPSSICLKDEISFSCQCKNNMTAISYDPNIASTGFCYLQHLQQCDIFNDMCDITKQLICSLESKCECANTTIYIEGEERCVLLPGARCDNGQRCISSTLCDPDEMICKCPAESHHSKDNPAMCVTSHGQNCVQGADDLCDPYDFLECSNNSECICNGENQTSYYDEQTRSCFELAGAECDPEPGKMPCVSSSVCLKDNTSFKCQCKNNMTIIPTNSANPNYGFCYLQHLQKCDAFNDFCDPTKFLECNQENNCECLSNPASIYSNELNTCVILPGESCNISEFHMQTCISGTFCDLKTHKCICPFGSRLSKLDKTACILNRGQDCRRPGSEGLCYPLQFLECKETFGNSTCICKDEGVASWFDHETKTCFRKVPFSCTNSSSSDLAVQHCTPNSDCVHENDQLICSCRHPFTRNTEGKCYLPFDSHCQNNRDLCDPASYLFCGLEGRCTCGKDSIYDDFTGKCLLLANAPCSLLSSTDIDSQPCVSNATCSRLSSKCECIESLFPNEDRFCRLIYGKTCQENGFLCDELTHLNCSVLSSRCLCNGEEYGMSRYDAFSRTCYTLPGARCDRNSPICTPNSYCHPLDKLCQCKSPYQRNQFGLCFLKYGQNCSQTNDLCDPDGFLKCGLSNTCECQRDFETFYDAETETCRLIHDRPCAPQNSTQYERIQQCDRNALCQNISPGNATHRCRCKPGGYIPNFESICFFPYNHPCKATEPEDHCDPLGYLMCNGTTNSCQCQHPDKTYYNEPSEQCLIFPGEKCSQALGSQKCREHSECTFEGICQCLPGYEETVDEECKLKFGEKCDQFTGGCNSVVNLKCINGTCGCRDEFVEHLINLEDKRSSHVCYPGINDKCEEVKVPGLNLTATCSPDSYLGCNATTNSCQCMYDSQIYIDSLKQCRVPRQMPCDKTERICIPGAECFFPEINDDYGYCECAEGFKTDWIEGIFCHSGTNVEKKSINLIFVVLTLYFMN